MSIKKVKMRDSTQELLDTLKRVKLDPIEVMSRAITLAETDGDYKEMMTGALGIMPYMYPKLKESVVKADIDQTITGGGVQLNITVGGKKVVGEVEEEEEVEDEAKQQTEQDEEKDES